MKNNVIIVSVGILVLIIGSILFYSRTKVNKTSIGVSVTNEKLISDDVSYVTADTEVSIARNKITKNANVSMKYKIKDQDEFTELFGQKITMVPFLVNTTCSMLTTALFEPEKVDQLSDDEKNKQDNQMESYLKGYTPTGFKLSFIDAETNENIADCESGQAGNKNIKFVTFRDYSGVDSIFRSKIGVFEEKIQ
ncbi:hypothetical protein HYV73_03155 [Candidatus Uhrbacteria bacterium]|nr:hypothetical protein [Candidatus Uhrbacteria bacterium]